MLKLTRPSTHRAAIPPAAFRRLCVETILPRRPQGGEFQPPSGGCVLKLQMICSRYSDHNQPPSGGCVLKPIGELLFGLPLQPAAFRRLCVETC